MDRNPKAYQVLAVGSCPKEIKTKLCINEPLMKNEREGKTEQGSVYSIYDQYYGLHIWSSSFYSGCKGIYIEEFFQPSQLRNLMVGGLQGEKWKFIKKYLKKNIQKCQSQLSGSFRRTPVHYAKWLRNSRNKRLISQPCKNLPSAWSDLLEMAVTPSFQLQIAYRLKHWIFDFLRFQMVYRI